MLALFRRGLVTVTVAALLVGAVPSCGDSDDGGSDGSCARGGDPCDTFCSGEPGCVECASNSDCGPGEPRCVAGRCEACADNDDCGTGQVCHPREHTCGLACASDGDCDDQAPLCDTASGQCVGC